MTKDETIQQLLNENERLQAQLKSEIKKNCIKDEVCIQQSKMAAMGEMIGNIAHQWRQPLMEISSILMSTEAQVKFEGAISNEELLERIAQANLILKYMSSTVDDFKNFFSKDKHKVPFKISEQIKRVVNILSSTLDQKDIKVSIIIKSNPLILGYKNEYSQVLINIISNAKDVLIQRAIKKGLIEVSVYQEGNNCVTEIIDNGGGIKNEYINEIFKPFMTFEKKDGTGIGLFMSKMIVENNMKGELLVENCERGAKFKITIPIEH